MAPVTEQLKTRYGKDVPLLIFTVGEPAYADMARKYAVRATPTYVVIRNGAEVGRIEGAGHTVADFDALLARAGHQPVKN